MGAHPPEPQARELEQFAQLQEEFVSQYKRIFPNPSAPRTIVVNPSISMDLEVLERIDGVQHYEERMLCLLLLLRMPRTRVIFLSSLPIHPSIIEYYLHLLPGIPSSHAHKRLSLLSCYDASDRPLTEKVLERPRLLQAIQRELRASENCHMSCFVVTELERTLAVTLGIPIFGCDPALSRWGTKSGSRTIFKELGVPVPAGHEHLRDELDLCAAIAQLKQEDPELRRVAIKLEEGASGEGNAILELSGLRPGPGLEHEISKHLPREIRCEAPGLEWDAYRDKFRTMGGIVETFIEGELKHSPSMQGRIAPEGQVDPVSTHDQELGGPSGQVFLGATFPALLDYRLEIQSLGLKVGRALADRGALGRYGVDFISVKDQGEWKHYAIEINLRKGGTTHPFLMLYFLTAGNYDPETGQFLTSSGRACTYFATDNLTRPSYRGLTPEDLIDIAACQGLHFNSATQSGVMFHLIGVLSQFGKLGAMCIDETLDGARSLYKETVATLDQATRPDS